MWKIFLLEKNEESWKNPHKRKSWLSHVWQGFHQCFKGWIQEKSHLPLPCEKSFCQKKNWGVMKGPTQKKPYDCPICDKNCINVLRMNTGEKSFTCPNVKNLFVRKNELWKDPHKRKPYDCPICDKVFINVLKDEYRRKNICLHHVKNHC